MSDTYNIKRMFFDNQRQDKIIRTGLTLQEAQAWCRDPETSSSTAADPTAVDAGPWFDGYDLEGESADVAFIVAANRTSSRMAAAKAREEAQR